ncbi:MULTISPECIES: hypothetical protein [unclassified Caballeronia]|uniref:hypothetical protein n=1 Tax=unclassified Caballeronia TaxID=2646786 RepID=UPI002028F585|nr:MULTISPECIES: hypothetical protein [unclassified Caballeronia]MDR5768108.1 hypothetical protein [Caballeronia sp. LZ028]
MDFKETLVGNGFTGVNIGSIERAGDYASLYLEAKRLKASAPVFGSSVDPSMLDSLQGASVFRVGAIEFDEITVMTLRMQKGSAQFIWLADAADPEFWTIFDNFKKTGQAGFAFRSGLSDLWFMPYRTKDVGTTAIDQYRRKVDGGDKGFVQLATVLIARQLISFAAASMIPSVPAEFKQVNILATRRVKSVVRTLERRAPLE